MAAIPIVLMVLQMTFQVAMFAARTVLTLVVMAVTAASGSAPRVRLGWKRVLW